METSKENLYSDAGTERVKANEVLWFQSESDDVDVNFT